MNLSILTATSDRIEAFALCERWMARQTVKPLQWIVCDDGEQPVKCTLGQEYHYWPEFRGYESMAKKVRRVMREKLIRGDGLVFVEDDDAYLPDWLEKVSLWLQSADIVGEGRAIYYYVRTRTWTQHGNMEHASLCETAVGRAFFPALQNLVETCLDPFMDHRIWELPKFRKLLLDPGQGKQVSVVGMKGMPGLGNYSGDNQFGPYPDPELNELRDMIGEDAQLYAGFHDPTIQKPAAVMMVPPPPPSRTIPVTSTVIRRLKVDVHLISFNEEAIMAYAMRHYASFATRIFLHDAHSTDRSREIARQFGAEVVDWNCSELIDDLELTAVKNECWQGSTADFVLVADVDEFAWFPQGTHNTLESYLRQGLAVVKPSGYEMITCHFNWQMENEPYPTTAGQIYDEVKYGARDDLWYAKPVLFSPKLVKESGIGIGSHAASLVLYDGRTIEVDRAYPKTQPPCYLLHYHQIGSIERIAAGYDAKLRKMCENNRRCNWGNHKPGIVHAKEKRDFILANLERVIP